MSLIATTDFIGAYKIAVDNYSELSNYIDQFEQLYLRKSVGDINAGNMTVYATMDQKYKDLWDGVTYTINDTNDSINSGLKTAVLGFIYFHYISDNFTNTVVGNVMGASENSTNTIDSVNAQIAINRFNTSVTIVKNDIRKFLANYYDITTISTGSSEVAGDYTILIPNTTYLYAGDTIYIGGTAYTVTSVVANTSFNITTTTGQDFSNLNIVWYPFNKGTDNVDYIAI